jgi:hypothetical protein
VQLSVEYHRDVPDAAKALQRALVEFRRQHRQPVVVATQAPGGAARLLHDIPALHDFPCADIAAVPDDSRWAPRPLQRPPPAVPALLPTAPPPPAWARLCLLQLVARCRLLRQLHPSLQVPRELQLPACPSTPLHSTPRRYPTLQWQVRAARRALHRASQAGGWLRDQLVLARYAHVPLAALGSDSSVAVADALLARNLRHAAHLLWVADPALPELGGAARGHEAGVFVAGELPLAEVCAPGAYRWAGGGGCSGTRPRWRACCCAGLGWAGLGWAPMLGGWLAQRGRGLPPCINKHSAPPGATAVCRAAARPLAADGLAPGRPPRCPMPRPTPPPRPTGP